MRGKIIFLFILAIFLIGSISAVTYCCEKTTSGAWCQNVNSESLCSTANNPLTGEQFKKTAASCEATSYCKPGTCVNLQEGVCMPNTPQIVCSGNYGYWSEQSKSELPQCQLGCCLIGDQAAFTTQIACNRLSNYYGLEINWQANINNELTCLASASPKAKGACVFTKNYVKTCELTTKKECQDNSKSSSLSEVEFHVSYLCSAQELGTNCAKSSKTQCDDNGDVRFIDTCGNLANIYDSDKATDENYWTYIQEPSCGDGTGNKNSATCGDCDYLSGSMCKKSGVSYVCKDLDCKDYTGVYSSTTSPYPRHGETWCTTDSKVSDDKNVPGATYFRLMCYNGEVTKEECESTRQEICAETEDEESGFMSSNCKVNIWEDCVLQNNSIDCEDVNVRDCKWHNWNGYYFTSEGLKNDDDKMPDGVCVPKYQPGFERDGSEDVTDTCTVANSICYVKYEKHLWEGQDKWTCTENCSCIEEDWENGMNSICTRLGDCGNKKNYLGKYGYQFEDVIKMQEVG